MEMKIYSLGLFALMPIGFWGLFSLNKDQGKFYKILLCSVGLVYLFLFLNDSPGLFLDSKDHFIAQKPFVSELFFVSLFFLFSFQLFLFLKLYPHRWIHSILYWIVFARLVAYPYGLNFEGYIALFVWGGFALVFYLWITLFLYRKNIICKILFFFSNLWVLHILAIWMLGEEITAFAEALPLHAFVKDFFIYFYQFLFLSEIPLALLGGSIFYVAFYAGEFVLCLAVWGILKDKNRNQTQEISQAKETNQIKEANQE